jgi:hypothetical protein
MGSLQNKPTTQQQATRMVFSFQRWITASSSSSGSESCDELSTLPVALSNNSNVKAHSCRRLSSSSLDGFATSSPRDVDIEVVSSENQLIAIMQQLGEDVSEEEAREMMATIEA